MREKLETTAQLRRFLAEVMVKISAQEIDANEAAQIVKVAHAINESFNVELKLRLVAAHTGDIVPRLGSLDIGKDEPTTPLIEQAP